MPQLLAKPIPVLLGTTPPLKRAPAQRKEELFWQTVSLLERLGARVDGVAVYDVWEGNERGKFRNKYGDNRPFALRLREATGKEQVVCTVTVHQGTEGFRTWLDETCAMNLWTQAYVGASTERFPVRGPHPREALAYAANRYDGRVTTGCITIPWRFREPQRLAKKAELGSRFALSQILLEPRSPIQLLDALAKLCGEREVEPPVVFWNFAPVVDVGTAREDFEFFEVVPAPENPAANSLALKNWERVAGAKDPLQESVELAAETLAAVLDHSLSLGIKPGITAEGMGAQNLPYVETLLRRLLAVRDEALAKHGQA